MNTSLTKNHLMTLTGITVERSPTDLYRFRDERNCFLKNSNPQSAMRRAGHNPTDIEVYDIINKIDDESGHLDFQVKNDGHDFFGLSMLTGYPIM